MLQKIVALPRSPNRYAEGIEAEKEYQQALKTAKDFATAPRLLMMQNSGNCRSARQRITGIVDLGYENEAGRDMRLHDCIAQGAWSRVNGISMISLKNLDQTQRPDWPMRTSLSLRRESLGEDSKTFTNKGIFL